MKEKQFINISLKRLFLRIVLGLVVLFSYAKRFFRTLFWVPARFLGHALWSRLISALAVTMYRWWYLPIKKFLRKFWHPSRSRLAFFISHRYLVHAVLILLTIVVTTSNIQARETTVTEDVGKKSLLYALVQREGDDEVVETMTVTETESKVSNLFEPTGYLSLRTPKISSSLGEAPVIISESNGSVVKPSLAITAIGDRPREGVIYHDVEAGETISTIAEAYDLNTSTLLWENRMGPRDIIKPGDRLTILPTNGVSHQIKSGETLDALAKKYQGDVSKIVEYNKLASAEDIRADDILIIPNGIRPADPVPVSRPRASIASSIGSLITGSAPQAGGASVTSGQLNRPTNGLQINQYFTWRHSGIDISRRDGLAIYAAENGRAEYVGWKSGYGNTIIINHGGGMQTLYGHLAAFYINDGDSVSRGQNIALMGSTGWSTGTHLHFEIWINGRKVNPLLYVK